MTFRALIALAVIAVIVGGSVLLSRGGDAGIELARVDAPSSDAGYSARDAELIETGPDGRPLYTLDAAEIRQLPRDGSVQLETVRMSYRDTNDNLWTLHAARGELHEASERIQLFGDVRISGALPETAGKAEISTDMLSFDTKTEIVSTHAPVTLNWLGRELHSTGLVANLKTRNVRLESNVHGLFSP